MVSMEEFNRIGPRVGQIAGAKAFPGPDRRATVRAFVTRHAA